MNELSENLQSIFEEKFKRKPALYYSPGRINLIGEHVDYNDGFVMPAAIDKGMYYAVALNGSHTANFYAVDFDESLSIDIHDIHKMDSWKNYVLGVMHELQNTGKELEGFDCVFGGNIANGAGMSSSAAVEGGVAFSLNELLSFSLDRKEMALLCQRAEHNYPGVKCGIMDQYANMFGKKDHVMLLDCRSITHEYFPLILEGYNLVLINTKVHHSLAASQYNQRRKECDEGLHILKEEGGMKSFRDVADSNELENFKNRMNENVFKRCKYVVEEIARTQQAAAFLKENNINEFGHLMFQTHEGLRHLYEVSCKELDFLVDHAAQFDGVAGARLMGGGFGGCTINIVRAHSKQSFINDILPAYKNAFGIDAEAYEVDVVDGTHRLG